MQGPHMKKINVTIRLDMVESEDVIYAFAA
jgi:hypothetical protein